MGMQAVASTQARAGVHQISARDQPLKMFSTYPDVPAKWRVGNELNARGILDMNYPRKGQEPKSFDSSHPIPYLVLM